MKPSPQMFDIARVAGRPGAPVWVELHTTDMSHSTAFYRRLFGWKPIGNGGGSRCIFELDGLRVAGWQGAVDGRPSWLTYFASVDAEATATTAETVGGAIVEPVHESAGGRVAILADNMGARFGVWQTLTSRGFGRSHEDNTFIWADLNTRACGKAVPFYGSVFGWTTFEPDGIAYKDFLVDGVMIGGAWEPPAGMPADLAPQWIPYFKVSDYESMANRVRELGGTVQSGPHRYIGGQFSICADSVGAYFGIITRGM